VNGPTGFEQLVEMAWATHEGLRRLGFSADDIFVLTTEDDRLFVQLKTQGKEFNVGVGLLGDLTHERFNEQWLVFVERANSGQFASELLQQIFDRWLQYETGGAMPLMNAIMGKGIHLPSRYRELS